MQLAGKYNDQINYNTSANSLAQQYISVLSNPNTSEQEKIKAMINLSELMNKQ